MLKHFSSLSNQVQVWTLLLTDLCPRMVPIQQVGVSIKIAQTIGSYMRSRYVSSIHKLKGPELGIVGPHFAQGLAKVGTGLAGSLGTQPPSPGQCARWAMAVRWPSRSWGLDRGSASWSHRHCTRVPKLLKEKTTYIYTYIYIYNYIYIYTHIYIYIHLQKIL